MERLHSRPDKLPRSIVRSLLLDQARRCAVNHAEAMQYQAKPSDVSKAWKKFENAKRAFESQTGESLETAM